MTLEIKHFRILKAVSAYGTISAAARELGYSQPAISLQVAQLEKFLQTPVLLRHGNGVSLTQAGQALLRAADPILERTTQVLMEVEAIAALRSGRIRVACFPSIAAVLLPNVFATIRKSSPRLTFSIIECESEDALKKLRTGECDAAVVSQYIGEGIGYDNALDLLPNERAIKMVEEPVYVGLPQDHRLAKQELVSLRELADDDWIAGCSQCRTNLIDLCGAAGFVPKIAFETDDRVAMQSLVGAGLGVALLHQMMLTSGSWVLPMELRACQPRSTRVIWVVTSDELLEVPGVGPMIAALSASAQSHEHASLQPSLPV